MIKKISWPSLLSLLTISMLISACGSVRELGYIQFEDDYSLLYSTLNGFSVTGSACSLDAKQAKRASIAASEFNVRSLQGNQRYKTHTKELERTVNNGVTCIKVATDLQLKYKAVNDLKLKYEKGR